MPRSPVFLNVISLVIESTRRFAPPPSRGQDPEQKETKKTKCLRKRDFLLFAPSCLIRALARQKTKEKIERRRARSDAPYQRFLAAPLFPSLPFVEWDAGPACRKRQPRIGTASL